MQDGAFYDAKDGRLRTIDRVIFVFAGGIYNSFEQFDPRAALPGEDLGYAISEEYRKEIKEFSDRKGPDFISRLRGYINIPGANADAGYGKHFLRRAIQLRGLLDSKLKGFQLAEPVIYALLTVDRYRHGVRSMEAILRMCTRTTKSIDTSSLPSRAQLNMHVDAEEFFLRLHRGRARMEPRIVTPVEQRLEKLLAYAEANPDSLIAKRIVAATDQVLEEISATANPPTT
jgi:hypothetical protein